MQHKSVFNWSGGKDSSLALYYALLDANYQIVKILTTVNQSHRRISMHGVREELLDEQAKQLGIALKKMYLPDQVGMEEYDSIMRTSIEELKTEGITHSVFGDIFLEDLKSYREAKLSEVGIRAHFPIWKKDTRELIHEFLDLGFKTILVSIKSDVLGREFAGRIIDHQFINDLPKGVDPCGENGEFHTFVFEGPIFKNPIPIEIGETIYREYSPSQQNDDTCHAQEYSNRGYWFTDIKLKTS